MQHLPRNDETPQYHDALPCKRQLSIRKPANVRHPTSTSVTADRFAPRAALATGSSTPPTHCELATPKVNIETHDCFPCIRALILKNTRGGEGCGVNTDASPRPSPFAAQEEGREAALRGDGGRQHCSMAIPLLQGRVLAWAWSFKVSVLPALFCHTLLWLWVFGAASPAAYPCASPLLAPRPALTANCPSFRSARFQVPRNAAEAAQWHIDGTSGSSSSSSSSSGEGTSSWGGGGVNQHLLLPAKWRGGVLGSTPTLPHAPPLWSCRDWWGREGGSTAADGNRCHKGEYRGGLGLSSRTVGAQEQGRRVESTSHSSPLLSLFSLPSRQLPSWTPVESRPLLIPPFHFPAASGIMALHDCSLSWGQHLLGLWLVGREPTGRWLWFASALATSGMGFESWAGSNFPLPHLENKSCSLRVLFPKGSGLSAAPTAGDGLVWHGDGTVWHGDGTVWHADGTVWHADGMVWHGYVWHGITPSPGWQSLEATGT
ncbi:unnamed protein product [Closterium sp. NIES-54]